MHQPNRVKRERLASDQKTHDVFQRIARRRSEHMDIESALFRADASDEQLRLARQEREDLKCEEAEAFRRAHLTSVALNAVVEDDQHWPSKTSLDDRVAHLHARFGEICPSGLVLHSFETTVRRLFAFDAIVMLREGLFFDDRSLTFRVTSKVGMELAGVLDSPDLDLATIRRVELDVEIPPLSRSVHIWLHPAVDRPADVTSLDGFLFFDQMLAVADEPESTLRTLADVMASMAHQLDARCLHVGRYDDDSLSVPDAGFRLPSVFGVYPRAVIDRLADPLRTRGAVVETTAIPGYVVVWVAPPGVLLDGGGAVASVVDLLREGLPAVVRASP